MKHKLINLLVMLLLIPIAHAISIELSLPSIIIQGETESASFTIQSDTLFNGMVYLSYDNIQSSVNSVPILNTSFSGSPHTYEFEWNIEGINQGEYTISADLKNESNVTLAIDEIQGSVESSAPVIVTKSPTEFVTTTSTILEITTNEDATCKYDLSNVSLADPSNTFEVTGETTHKQPLRNLEQKTYTYYLKCKDSAGNEMSESEIIEFTVDLPPTAEITLSDDTPLKAGVVGVTVETSEDLEETPILEYSFDDNPDSKRPVSLTGSDSKWKGYMIITEDYDNLVGTFYFSGKDSLGTIGHTITYGNSFVVDTTKPPPPISLEAISKKGRSIELEWYYDGEEIDYFKMYRSTSSGVDYIDYYAQINGSTHYIDDSTENKVTYYYKINAVDLAGNIGPLSEEVYATALREGSSEETETKTEPEEETPKLLPPNLVIKVNDEIKKVEKLLIDVDEISSNLEKEEDKELISDLELIDKIKSTKTKLEDLKQQLDILKLHYKTEAELDSELDDIDLEIKKIQQTTPKEIELIAKSNLIQSLSQENIDLAIEKLFFNFDFSDIDQNKYKKQNKIIQKNIEVAITIYVVEIEFIDGTKKDQTLIIKSISHKNPEPLKDVILFEIIPKELAENLDEINFLTKNYEVIEHDPIVKFGFSQLDFNGTKIKYSLDKKVTADTARKAASVVLIGPIQLEQSYSKVTGFSIASITGRTIGIGTTQIIFIVVGFSIIAILLIYQFFIAQKTNLPKFEFFNNLRKKSSSIINNLFSKKEDNQFSVKTKTKTEFEVIQELIDWSYRHLDKNEIDEVKLLYPRIQLLYKSLSKEDKSKVIKKCSDLQDRINKKEEFF